MSYYEFCEHMGEAYDESELAELYQDFLAWTRSEAAWVEWFRQANPWRVDMRAYEELRQ